VTQERQTKIAVIGTAGPRYESGEARVEWFPWNRLKNLKNLADYDNVILDLLSMTDQTLQDGETFDSILNEQSMLEVLVSKNQERPNGAIFVQACSLCVRPMGGVSVTEKCGRGGPPRKHGPHRHGPEGTAYPPPGPLSHRQPCVAGLKSRSALY
jgi:hypothetical protein